MNTSLPPSDETVDVVIREVRLTKERLAAEHGFDVRRIAAAARAKESLSGHRVISRPVART